jgi:hypothetical protein
MEFDMVYVVVWNFFLNRVGAHFLCMSVDFFYAAACAGKCFLKFNLKKLKHGCDSPFCLPSWPNLDVLTSDMCSDWTLLI